MNHSDEIKSRIDIVELLSQYIPLKAAGSNFRAVCPFHNEKTPSLMVSPEKQIWHCFGCGKGGDIFSFIMEMEGLDFVEALKLLAPRAGVILDNKAFSEDKNKNKLLEIMEISSKYYNFILTSEKNDENKNIKQIREYLLNRGLCIDAINRWGIGYSQDSFDDLTNFLKSKNFSENDILLSGMSIKSEKGNYFNRFRNRIMFPIRDVSGRVIAFTARINPFSDEQDKSFGKYVNSPQTSLYDKSRVLFALDRAKSSIKKENEVVVVEGQMDAISAHEAGIENVVASSGTALSSQQISLIKRYTDNVVFSFDQDLAGSAASERAVSEGLKDRISLKIAVFDKNETGKDPDEIIRKDPGVFKEAIIKSKNAIDYFINREIKNTNLNDSKQKNRAVNKILEFINLLYNKVEQDFYLKELGQKFFVNEVFLREELLKIRKGGLLINKKDFTNNKFAQTNKDLKDRDDKLVELLFSLIIKFPDNIEYVIANLPVDFLPIKYGRIYSLILDCYNRDKKLDYNNFLMYIKDNNNSSELDVFDFVNKISLLAEFYLQEIDSDDIIFKVKKEILSIIIDIKKIYYKKGVDRKEEELIIAEKEKNKDKSSLILLELKDLNDKLRKLS